jgi:hypothetical protein|tara:strand:- start:269 stop:1387 length:1119 start_codon:yes stop_codon:yes gene_type:complete
LIDSFSHLNYKNPSIEGRYLPWTDLKQITERWDSFVIKDLIGVSVNGNSIPVYRFGFGNKTILMWSQMHGNESTTTKGLIDFIGFLNTDSETSNKILNQCTLIVIPILNPDGASAYTRFNKNQVDLNRDFQDFSQPESVFLKSVFDHVSPDFCFNLHDQRTIFSVGSPAKPATMSFLAPAADKDCALTPSREIAMKLIAVINDTLQQMIPNQIGRFDDAFNNQCVGDYFQELGVPTILFEAGHYPEDYKREVSRALVFHALFSAVNSIACESYSSYPIDAYFDIPENQKNFLDIGVIHPHLVNKHIPKDSVVAIQYKEVLEAGEIRFIPEFHAIDQENKFSFHRIVDLSVLKSDLQTTVLHNIRDIVAAICV